MAEKDVTLNKNNSGTLPVIPLRNLLLAPNTITPLLVGRELSIHAAETALISDKMIICVTQKYEALTDEDPKAKDLYRYGTICTILQTMKLPDGNMRLLVEGEKRVLIKKYRRNKKYLTANYIVQDKVLSEKELESEALLRSFRKAFKSYVNLNKSIPEEAMIPLSDAENADEFFYYALSNIQLDITKKQQLFELSDLFESISQLYRIVIEEIQILKLEYKIDGTVKSKLSKLQREYYLNEQLKAIHKELGITKEDKTELLEFKKKVEKVNLSDQAKKKAEGELERVIIQSMKKAGTTNPLIMMDEIDKMSSDFRGDPASALLEVLDPEQNNSFRDHYLDFEYDLSQVIFITTANTLNSIPQPLLDRMEVIEIPGYTAYEKIHIATKHLVPKVIKEHDLKGKVKIKYQKKTLERIIKLYTREAGVRGLERQIAKILRKIAKKYVEGKIKGFVSVKATDLEEYLGIPKHLYSEVNRKDAVGLVTGLAWTRFGGETLQIEVIKVKGKGNLKLTGQLGDVMQESAQAAFSYARLHTTKYNIDENFYKKCDLHLHIPEGAIPKDGPSAGVTLVTAIISILSNRKVKHNIAMTGEITLSGNVLPIGGLAEKLIAVKRAKIKNVLVPRKNEPSLTEVNDEIKKGLNIILVDTIEEVLQYALH